MKFFKPVTNAFSDTILQVRAKPLVFLLIWVTLSLAPQLILSFAFEKPVSDMMDASFQLIDESLNTDGEISGPTGESSDSISKGIRAVLVMLVVLLFTEIYLGSVLAGVVRQFRKRIIPVYTESLREGLKHFTPFAKTVFVAAFKILTVPFIVFISAAVFGGLLNQPVIIYFSFFVSAVLFLNALLRYGLAPFIHLSMGTGGKDSVAISKIFYLSHRPAVSALFMFVILLPMVIVSFLMNLLISFGLFTGAGGMILGILQSLLQLTMTVVTINFAMNHFRPQDWGIGENTLTTESVD